MGCEPSYLPAALSVKGGARCVKLAPARPIESAMSGRSLFIDPETAERLFGLKVFGRVMSSDADRRRECKDSPCDGMIPASGL